MNITFNRQLPTPQEIKSMYPLSDELAKKKKANDEEIKKIFTNESDKFLLIIGPCSADREDAVIDYIKRLRKIADEDILVLSPSVLISELINLLESTVSLIFISLKLSISVSFILYMIYLNNIFY